MAVLARDLPDPGVVRRVDPWTWHVRQTCERIVTALSCVDASCVDAAVARRCLVAMHDAAVSERAWIAGLDAEARRRGGDRIGDYDVTFVRIDALVLQAIVGEAWDDGSREPSLMARLRAAIAELVRVAPDWRTDQVRP